MEGLLCGAVKHLRNHRGKPDQVGNRHECWAYEWNIKACKIDLLIDSFILISGVSPIVDVLG